MSDLFTWLGDVLWTAFGWLGTLISSVVDMISAGLYQMFINFVNFLQWQFGWLLLGLYFCVDRIIYMIINGLRTIIGGDVFNLVGIQRSTLESYYYTVYTVAPFAKLAGYVINLDALQNCFRLFLSFLIFWAAYRAFRLWFAMAK